MFFFYKKGMLGCEFSKFSTYFDEKMFKIIKLDIFPNRKKQNEGCK